MVDEEIKPNKEVQAKEQDKKAAEAVEKKEKKQEKPVPKKEEKKEKPKKESILTQAKQMAQAKKTGKAPAKEDPKKEVKKGPARVYTISLKKCRPRTKKVRKAVIQIKNFVLKHTKQEPVIDQELNELLWSHGKEKPPARIRVSVETTDDGKSFVSLKK
jgi:ribosomal protein L31E